MKVTIMGLGLNGGGFAAAEYFAKCNAEVTVTDLRSAEILKPTMDKLSQYKNIKYALGEHNLEDFENADIVIKNPAVRKDSPYLKVAKNIQTDITIFLSRVKNPIVAVTGSKGKSTTVKAIDYIFCENKTPALLGGNITISPLSFIDEAIKNPQRVVVLELSSWQLADINFIEEKNGQQLLFPEIAVITNIMNDHQNAYTKFSDYVDDKKIVYKNCNKDSLFITKHDKYGDEFTAEVKCKSIYIEDIDNSILPGTLLVPGEHVKENLKIAAMCAKHFSIKDDIIKKALSSFKGVPYRLEQVGQYKNITFYDDSAATMPDAMLAACKSFSEPIILITGGTDKKLDIEPFQDLPKNVKYLSLLFGSLTSRVLELDKIKNIKKSEPNKTMKEAFDLAVAEAEKLSENVIVLLSPGAASFELFLNEFDRGNQFNALVKNLVQG